MQTSTASHPSCARQHAASNRSAEQNGEQNGESVWGRVCAVLLGMRQRGRHYAVWAAPSRDGCVTRHQLLPALERVASVPEWRAALEPHSLPPLVWFPAAPHRLLPCLLWHSSSSRSRRTGLSLLCGDILRELRSRILSSDSRIIEFCPAVE